MTARRSMRLQVDGVLRPMTDERAIELVAWNKPCRDHVEALAARLIEKHPDTPPESFQVVRVIRGYYDRIRKPVEA